MLYQLLFFCLGTRVLSHSAGGVCTHLHTWYVSFAMRMVLWLSFWSAWPPSVGKILQICLNHDQLISYCDVRQLQIIKSSASDPLY